MNKRWTAAGVLLLLKAVLGAWGAFALLAASSTHHRTFLGGVIRHRQAALGAILGVLAALSVVVGVALLASVPWARVAAFILEGAGIVLALARIVSRPGSSLLSLVLSLVVIGLLVGPVGAQSVSRPGAAAR